MAFDYKDIKPGMIVNGEQLALLYSDICTQTTTKLGKGGYLNIYSQHMPSFPIKSLDPLDKSNLKDFPVSTVPTNPA
jgi:hypothetical protein